MNDKYVRATIVLRREIPSLSADAACRVLDAILDVAWDDHQARATTPVCPHCGGAMHHSTTCPAGLAVKADG